MELVDPNLDVKIPEVEIWFITLNGNIYSSLFPVILTFSPAVLTVLEL